MTTRAFPTKRWPVSVPVARVRVASWRAVPGGPQAPEEAASLPPSEWISDYTDSVLDPEALRVEVDTFMEAYDRKMAEVGFLGPHLTGAVGKAAPWVRGAPEGGGGDAADLVTEGI